MIKKIRDIAIVVLVALTVWELLVRVTGVPSFILPGPLRVGRAAVDHAELIGEHALVTLSEVLAGLLLGTVLGISTSLYLMVSGSARRLLLP